ncbi:MAG: cytochrome B6 [Neisseriaceae bacterium]|nr:MAG: cytochrome B6 [Neisseriaceae bacterium]
MKSKSQFKYYVQLCLALLLWAGLYHVAKPAAEVSDPYLVAFLRYLISASLLLIILRVKEGHWFPALNMKQWLLVFCIGALGICAYNIMFFSAEALISGNVVAILYSFTPCLTTIISSFVFRTKLNWLSKIGIVIAMFGSIGVVNYATPTCEQFFCSDILHVVGKGEIYGILATLIFACYSVLSRYTSQQNVSALIMNAYAAVFGCLLLGGIAVVRSDFSIIPQLHFSFWLALIYISVLATVVAYLWYTNAIINLGVFKTAVFQNSIPFQTVLIGYVFFNEKIGLGELVCGAIVIGGVYITNFALSYKRGTS